MTEFKYQALQTELEKSIQSGIYSNKLPSVRQLAKIKMVSISTVQKAYDALERSGLITAEAKKGYFVNQTNSESTIDYGKDYQQVLTKDAQEKQVLFSLNDENVLPLSSTAPSSIINNEPLLSKLHKKVFDKSIYQFHIEDEVQGSEKLRQTISMYLQRQQHLRSPSKIHIVAGRREALFVSLVATKSLNETIAVESPTSFYFQSAISRLCRKVIEIPMQQTYEQELELLDKAYLKHKFRCYLVNPSFNDPTGRVLTDAQKNALLSWAQKRHVTLIEYDRSELHFSANKPSSIAQLAEHFTDAQVISIQDFFDTVSTRICLGFVICVNTNEAFAQAKHTVTEEPNLHSQNLLNELIKTGHYETRLKQLRKTLQSNYLKTRHIFEQHLPSIVTHQNIQGGPCLWLHSPEHDSAEIWRHLIKQQIAIAPGSLFGSNKEFKHFFRITFALPWNSKLALAMNKICKALQ